MWRNFRVRRQSVLRDFKEVYYYAKQLRKPTWSECRGREGQPWRSLQGRVTVSVSNLFNDKGSWRARTVNYCFTHFFLACGFMFSLDSIIVFKRGKDDGAQHGVPALWGWGRRVTEGLRPGWPLCWVQRETGMHSGTCSKVTNANNLKKLFWIEMTLDLHGSS